MLEILQDGQRRIEELIELVEQMQPMQPADLARLRMTQIVLDIVVKVESLKQVLLKEMGQS